VLRRGLEGTDIKGIVLTMYPAATVAALAGAHSASEFVEWCRRRDIAVVATTLEPPRSTINHYESTLDIRGAGAIVRTDILPEVALAKLAWSLGATTSLKDVRAMFDIDIAGERLGFTTH
jgi:L-asparaginase/Glu-tRNA(Gln) amidotransferase subunit D